MANQTPRICHADMVAGEPVMVIPLTRGHTAVVDIDVFPRIAGEYGTSWSAYDNGRGHLNARYDHKTAQGWRALTLARAVMQPGEDEEVRAVNGNALDCRASNLTTAPRRGRRMRSQRHLHATASV